MRPRPRARVRGLSRFEREVPERVLEADVAHHPVEQAAVVGKETLSHVLGQEIADETAEVLVSGEGKEDTRVREHAKETGGEGHVREREHLRLHTVNLFE